MMNLGFIDLLGYLERVNGMVTGSVITDAKDRRYHREYVWGDLGNDMLLIQRKDGHGDAVPIPKKINLDKSLIAFFGLYSGDGAKGSEDSGNTGRILPTISFSQKEKHLVRFAVDQFLKIFQYEIKFTFSLGEDSAYFMDGEGMRRLEDYYISIGRPELLVIPPLNEVRPILSSQDFSYMAEIRHDVPTSNEWNLAFYYHHKEAMENILSSEKESEIQSVGIDTTLSNISVTASLRRPFKKGARLPGGSSRSDEIHVGGLNGIGELFLKMMHEIEDSILSDSRISSTGLVVWNDKPSSVGQSIDVVTFFTSNPYGRINNQYPDISIVESDFFVGRFRLSKDVRIKRQLIIDPLWCYIAGLYLAEGSTPKGVLFKMFKSKPDSLSLGFTSSEGVSIELMLRALRKLFPASACLETWKVKVGSQYFSELVMTGLKHGVPMLRGGNSGDGKLRTMEISLAIKQWALEVADATLKDTTSLLRQEYADKYSHVEPTGAGVARIDFSASSSICRWYFPLLMFTVFGEIVIDPTKEFY